MIYIVTRHTGAVAWLRAKGFDGEVVPHLSTDAIQPGNSYIGVLPIPMIKQILDAGSRFFLLMLPEVTAAQRERELSPPEMDAAGARLVEVKAIEMVPVEMAG